MTSDSPALSRRRLVMAGAGGLAGAAALPAIAATAAQAGTDPADRDVVLVGANPGLRLFDGDDVTTFASVWQVDWSTHGTGNAVVLWHDGAVRVLSRHRELAEWLERAFVRHFPEVEGLPWPRPTVEYSPVRVDIDLRRGMHARAGDVDVRMSGVLHRRTFETDEFDLGGRVHSLSNLFAPCADAAVHVRGRRLPGSVVRGGTPQRPSSSAFLATAEIWKV